MDTLAVWLIPETKHGPMIMPISDDPDKHYNDGICLGFAKGYWEQGIFIPTRIYTEIAECAMFITSYFTYGTPAANACKSPNVEAVCKVLGIRVK